MPSIGSQAAAVSKDMGSGKEMQTMMDGIVELIEANGLEYETYAPLIVATQVTSVLTYAQQMSYGQGSTALFFNNTGSTFVDPYNSYLKVDFTVSTAPTNGQSLTNFGIRTPNGFLDAISAIRISTKSGEVFNQPVYSNLIARIRNRFEMSEPYWRQYSALWLADQLLQNGVQYTAIIPLPVLCSFFEVPNKLLPPQLMSNLKIEIQFYTSGQGLQEAGTNLSSSQGPVSAPAQAWQSMTAANMWISYRVHTLTDAISRRILGMSASGGLEIAVPIWLHNNVQTTSSTYELQLTHTASRMELLVGWLNWSFQETDPGQDKIGAIRWNKPYVVQPGVLISGPAPQNVPQPKTGTTVINVQSRQGSIYLPSVPLTTEQEIFWHRIAAFGGQLNRNSVLNDCFYGPNTTDIVAAFNTSKSFLYESGSAVNANRQASITWNVSKLQGGPAPGDQGGSIDYHIVGKVRRIINVSLESSAVLQ
jgi:hypothetical protein